jgi:pilus assembly protein CpaF
MTVPNRLQLGVRRGGGLPMAVPSGMMRTPGGVDLEARQTSLSPQVQAEIQQVVSERINVDAAGKMDHADLVPQLDDLIGAIVRDRKLQINAAEQRSLALSIADDMLGVGPLESLMRDDSITDVLVFGPEKVVVERRGKMSQVPVRFRDEAHLRGIAARIARYVNRRLDEANPLVDARLPDGSRVNIVIPPVALDGTMISIRKFSKQEITLDTMVRYGSISDRMKDFLRIASEARLNIVVSGGTGSGKTTLLNAISRHILPHEQVVTIEDAAELRLQQPFVRRLETRPRMGDQAAEHIDQRRLVANALRMRPDRIILGEVRQGEAFDLLQAMNTGHEGSLATLHANTPRDALARLENMILMAGFELPLRAIRNQIASAIDVIVQVERMIDGARRVVNIIEVTGIEGDVISTQDLFHFEVLEQRGGQIKGEYVCANAQLRSRDKLRRAGLEAEARRIFAQGS